MEIIWEREKAKGKAWKEMKGKDDSQSEGRDEESKQTKDREKGRVMIVGKEGKEPIRRETSYNE